MKSVLKLFVLCLSGWLTCPSAYGALHVVAAENVYGAIAEELGGADVVVASVLNNPNQDPHLFTAKPSTSKMVADADILILNGADYDAWFSRLLTVKSNSVTVINVANLVGVKAGANPHLWYSLRYVQLFAIALTKTYEQRIPARRLVFEARLQDFLSQLAQLNAKILALKVQLRGASVTATEPVAAYLTEELGLVVLDQAFQLAVMNDTEPSATSRAQFEQHLRRKQVRALIYNEQVQDPVTEFMQRLSEEQHIPIIGVTELLPPGQRYAKWYQQTVDAFTRARFKSGAAN